MLGIFKKLVKIAELLSKKTAQETVKCKECGVILPANDFAAQVDHCYKKHNAKDDEHAKSMARIYFETEATKKKAQQGPIPEATQPATDEGKAIELGEEPEEIEEKDKEEEEDALKKKKKPEIEVGGDKKTADIHSEIKRIKQKLIQKAKIKGLWENFGQKEYRMLRDKYGKDYYSNKEIQNALTSFNEWIMNYTPIESSKKTADEPTDTDQAALEYLTQLLLDGKAIDEAVETTKSNFYKQENRYTKLAKAIKYGTKIWKKESGKIPKGFVSGIAKENGKELYFIYPQSLFKTAVTSFVRQGITINYVTSEMEEPDWFKRLGQEQRYKGFILCQEPEGVRLRSNKLKEAMFPVFESFDQAKKWIDTLTKPQLDEYLGPIYSEFIIPKHPRTESDKKTAEKVTLKQLESILSAEEIKLLFKDGHPSAWVEYIIGGQTIMWNPEDAVFEITMSKTEKIPTGIKEIDKALEKGIPLKDFINFSSDKKTAQFGVEYLIKDLSTGKQLLRTRSRSHARDELDKFKSKGMNVDLFIASKKTAGNPVNEDLPGDVDSFLQDIAQDFGGISYDDIMKLKPTKDVLSTLRNYMRQITNLIGAKGILKEPEAGNIAKEVASFVKSKTASTKKTADFKVGDKVKVLHPIKEVYVGAVIRDISSKGAYVEDQHGDKYPVALWQVYPWDYEPEKQAGVQIHCPYCKRLVDYNPDDDSHICEYCGKQFVVDSDGLAYQLASSKKTAQDIEPYEKGSIVFSVCPKCGTKYKYYVNPDLLTCPKCGHKGLEKKWLWEYLKEHPEVASKKTAILKQKKNKNTGKTEWALVSKKDPSKVLKWFGVTRPSKETVDKEEKRVQYFKSKSYRKFVGPGIKKPVYRSFSNFVQDKVKLGDVITAYDINGEVIEIDVPGLEYISKDNFKQAVGVSVDINGIERFIPYSDITGVTHVQTKYEKLFSKLKRTLDKVQ
jgi:uncharacterized OB-fold protein